MGDVVRPNNPPRHNPTGAVARNPLVVACGTAKQRPRDSGIEKTATTMMPSYEQSACWRGNDRCYLVDMTG